MGSLCQGRSGETTSEKDEEKSLSQGSVIEDTSDDTIIDEDYRENSVLTFEPFHVFLESRMILISTIIRHDFRLIFGIKSYTQSGFFFEKHMAELVHHYSDWVEYPKSDYHWEGHENYIMAVVISKDGRYLFTGSEDCTIICWDLETTEKCGTIPVRSPVLAMDLHRNRLVCGCDNGSLFIWDDFSYDSRVELMGHGSHCATDGSTPLSSSVISVTFNGDGTYIFSGSRDNTIRIWSSSEMKCVGTMEGHSGSVNSLICVSNAADLLSGNMNVISGCWDKSMKVWTVMPPAIDNDGQKNTNNPRFDCIQTIPETVDDSDDQLTWILGIIQSYNCDGSLMASMNSKQIHIRKMSNLLDIVHTIRHCSALCGCFHPWKPNLLALGCDFDKLRLFDISENDPCLLERFRPHSQPIQDICFTPNGHKLISVSVDGSISVVDISSHL